MKHGSLFSGIGGFDLAAEWMGWENVFHCEWNEFGQKILKHYWPNAESYGDITKTDFTIWRGKIDILTGGFPCQPYSSAGKRLGKEDDRHLWPEMLRAIGEISPRYIVGENVRGLTNWNGGLVFDEVQADLESEGYEVTPFLLPSVAVNAPHRRDRIWFVAYSNKCTAGPSRTSERTIGSWSNNNDEPKEWGKQAEQHNGCGDVLRVHSDTRLFGQAERQEQTMGIKELSKERYVTYPNTGRFKECWPKWFTSGELTQDYGLTSEPGICRGDDGFPYRVDRLKALGNAIVPQVALQIFKAIEEYENQR